MASFKILFWNLPRKVEVSHKNPQLDCRRQECKSFLYSVQYNLRVTSLFSLYVYNEELQNTMNYLAT
jgi:hypothetical protein